MIAASVVGVSREFLSLRASDWTPGRWSRCVRGPGGHQLCRGRGRAAVPGGRRHQASGLSDSPWSLVFLLHLGPCRGAAARVCCPEAAGWGAGLPVPVPRNAQDLRAARPWPGSGCGLCSRPACLASTSPMSSLPRGTCKLIPEVLQPTRKYTFSKKVYFESCTPDSSCPIFI